MSYRFSITRLKPWKWVYINFKIEKVIFKDGNQKVFVHSSWILWKIENDLFNDIEYLECSLNKSKWTILPDCMDVNASLSAVNMKTLHILDKEWVKYQTIPIISLELVEEYFLVVFQKSERDLLNLNINNLIYKWDTLVTKGKSYLFRSDKFLYNKEAESIKWIVRLKELKEWNISLCEDEIKDLFEKNKISWCKFLDIDVINSTQENPKISI